MPAHPVSESPRTAGTVASISAVHFRRICHELGLASRLELVLLIKDRECLTCGRLMDPVIAEDLMKRIRSTWDVDTHTAQIQYVQLSKCDAPLLLFTIPLAASLLTLAARIETSISVLSRNADSLSACLLRGAGSLPDSGEKADVIGAYAIAWKPVEPMSRAMRQAVESSVRNLAQEKGCHLTFVGVATDHVHLVINCPAYKTSSWVAYSFKSGTQRDIRRQFDLSNDLWREGFLASASAEPLAGEELLTYLNGAG